MELIYAGRTSAGRVRPINEDCLDFWRPDSPEDWRSRGAVSILADGVGGHSQGEVASRLACTHAKRVFVESRPGLSPGQLLWRMFNAANLAVYDAGLDARSAGGRMLTTLTISVFRNDEVVIGHVGDCRAYVVAQGRIRRITSDHSYAGVQLKLGIITVEEAASSRLRSVLTRSVGQDPVIRIDYHTVAVNRGDKIVQCTDGLWGWVGEREMFEIVSKHSPDEACRRLIERAEELGGDDNLSVQVVQVEGVERLSFYRGVPMYQKIDGGGTGGEPEVGQLLDRRYELTHLISRSGMASIYKATDVQENRVVALKIPFTQFESDPGFYARFRREQEIGTALNHPYVLRVEPDDGRRSRPYLVMEFLEGQTLEHLMRSLRPMPQTDALKIAGRICEALHYLHEHEVVHRDLKPANIMICNDGSIRIMDFGIAKVEGQRRLTFGGFTPAMGTPDYMAPEQVRGKRGDRRTDIYSLGAILYEMLTGSVPFEGANPFLIMNARLDRDPPAPRLRNPSLSPQAEQIVLHAMARRPQDRYPTATEMKHDLDRPDELPFLTRPGRPARGLRGTLRRPGVLVFALGVLLLGALAWFLRLHLTVTWTR